MQGVGQGEAGKVRVGERHEAEMRAMDSKLPLTPHFFQDREKGEATAPMRNTGRPGRVASGIASGSIQGRASFAVGRG